MFDLIIIGASAAGCSAAVYAARRELNFKIVTDNIGGEVALSGEVGNWPGIINIQGFELAQKFAEQIKSYNVPIDEGFKVTKIEKTANYFTVFAQNATNETKSYETKTVIVATGIHPRQLGVPGEKNFFHQGVTYCTVCDGPLFRGKTTVTIGSGNAALESALMMGQLAKKVYLLSKYPNTQEQNGGFPKGENILIDKVKELKNVEILYEATTTAIVGDKKVTALKYKNTQGEEKEIIVDGVMVHIGMTPNSELVDVAKDKIGQIIVDAKCQTSVSGIFAAGDVGNLPYKQIAIAAGQGVIASLAAIEYVNRWK
ncbi:MAG: FAD-dependent oxidoreductase [Candidatus Magasanikbacteria bacterium]